MAPPEINPGDTVVELAALVNTTAMASGAVIAACLTYLAKHNGLASVAGFFSGAVVGFAVGQVVARIYYRSNENTLIVKAGAGALATTIPAGLSDGVLSAFVVWFLAWFVFRHNPTMASIAITIGRSVVIGIGTACLSSLG